MKHCQKKKKDHQGMRPSGPTREEAGGQDNGYEKKAEEEEKRPRTHKFFPKCV